MNAEQFGQAFHRFAFHSDVQHSALAHAWLRHFCPIQCSELSAAYLGVRFQMYVRFFVLILATFLSGAGMDDKDSKTIEALRSNGSDVTKPHEIDFFLDFDHFEEAAPVAQAMDREGFAVRMFENQDGSFTIEAKKVMVPSLETMRGVSDQLNQLTAKHGGNYDGWGAEVTE